ncbi:MULTISPECIES: methyltransferase family protein [Sphingomonas]|uniref:methyltransferase family protein n=1 Tax=Sphingomonas TaxID=13687 RepID=UPI000DEF80C6|nr:MULTISPECIES: isoprenylcysteine carboxylmethyltransferase family protein [Sphingomonas]
MTANTAEIAPPSPRGRSYNVRVGLDIAERVCLILAAAPFLMRFSTALQQDPWILGLILGEMMTVGLLLIRRPGPMAGHPWAIFVALVGTFTPLFVRAPNIPAYIEAGKVLMWVGFAMSLGAKLSLNRSFGMIAANRGVRRGGVYALIRHPMYMGYAITHVGFIMVYPSLVNALMYLFTWTFQLLRIREEEKWLMQDPAYAEYAAHVRYRLIPGVY